MSTKIEASRQLQIHDDVDWGGHRVTNAADPAAAQDYVTRGYLEAHAPAETASTIGALVHGAGSKTTPADTDEVAIADSAASWVLKRLSWSNIKTALSSIFVAVTRTVNGHALSSDVTLGYPDLAAGAVADGTTAVTQAAGDNSTALATTAYADAGDAATLATAQAYTDAAVAEAGGGDTGGDLDFGTW